MTKAVLMPHDKVHSAAAILEEIIQLKFELPHVTYIAKPAPSDYHIFGALKEDLHGWKIYQPWYYVRSE